MRDQHRLCWPSRFGLREDDDIAAIRTSRQVFKNLCSLALRQSALDKSGKHVSVRMRRRHRAAQPALHEFWNLRQPNSLFRGLARTGGEPLVRER